MDDSFLIFGMVFNILFALLCNNLQLQYGFYITHDDDGVVRRGLQLGMGSFMSSIAVEISLQGFFVILKFIFLFSLSLQWKMTSSNNLTIGSY